MYCLDNIVNLLGNVAEVFCILGEKKIWPLIKNDP